jgi:hypothetical protein
MSIAFFNKATAKNPQLQGQQIVSHNEDTDRYQLNSNDFLRRLGLEVSEEVLAYLQGISDRTGRSINEIAAAIIAQDAEQFDS